MLTGTPGYMAPEQRALGTRAVGANRRLRARAGPVRAARRTSPRSTDRAAGACRRARRRWFRTSTRSSSAWSCRRFRRIRAIGRHRRSRWRRACRTSEPAAAPGVADRRSATRAEDAVVARGQRAGGGRGHRWLVASSFFVSPGARTLTEQDTIVLADFENTTGEPVFDGALKVALAVALEQSPFLKVFPDDRARETLRLMQRSPDERVTRSIAREIARREQLKALLAGSIASLGRNYVLALEAINAETGDVMAREQAEAASKEQVLTSLGAATSRLREKLGESLASIQKFDVPLPRATTAVARRAPCLLARTLRRPGSSASRSDSAPQARDRARSDLCHGARAPVRRLRQHRSVGAGAGVFAEGIRAAGQGERARAVLHFVALLSRRDTGLGQGARAGAILDGDVSARSVRLQQSGQRAASPRPVRAVGRSRFAKPSDSIPGSSRRTANLAAALLALNRFDEARAVLQQAADRQLDFIGAAACRTSWRSSRAIRRRWRASWSRRWACARPTRRSAGRRTPPRLPDASRTAHEQFRRGIQMSLQGNFQEVAAQLTMEDAETHATRRTVRRGAQRGGRRGSS